MTQNKIEVINVGTGLPGNTNCNFRCCYCRYGNNLERWQGDHNENVFEILSHIGSNYSPKIIHYTGGEICVSPFRDSILDLWNTHKWNGIIYTNGSVYCDKMAVLLSDRLVTLRCSLDAGTKETFKSVKGVDCYNKVLSNLRQYASTGGSIELKYIILDGKNDNETDIYGFVRFAEEIGATILVMLDMNACIHMSDSVFYALKTIAMLCDKKGVTCTVMPNFMSPNDFQRVVAEGLIR